ncbi:MAG: RDD family protein [Cyanobacteria bacterium J06636_16]
MIRRNRDTSLGMGVYFAPSDYVGVMRRILIIVIDATVLAVAYAVLASFLITVTGALDGSFTTLYLLCTWMYLTVLKTSRIRTVGYRLAGARILTLQGERPSIFRMTFRLLLWGLDPFSLIFNVFWSSLDEDYQTLSDRFAGTYLVNNRARPMGTAEIHLAYYYAFGLALMYSRVMHPEIRN